MTRQGSTLSDMAGTLNIKRIYRPPDAEDGWRVLVDRLWPRGLSKESAALDAWEKEIAPSPKLRKWFGHSAERFETFAASYRAELDASIPAGQFVELCREKLLTQNVTLLYAAKNESCNHAVVLRDWLQEQKNLSSYGGKIHNAQD